MQEDRVRSTPIAKRRLTDVDVPPIPPMLRKDATDAEKAARAGHMKARRRVQMQLQEQQRPARNRDDRNRPDAKEDVKRRAAQRLLASVKGTIFHPHACTCTDDRRMIARSELPSLCPETCPYTFAALLRLYKEAIRSGADEHYDAVDDAWERFLQRPLGLRKYGNRSYTYDEDCDEPTLYISQERRNGLPHGKGMMLIQGWCGLELHQGMLKDGELYRGTEHHFGELYTNAACTTTEYKLSKIVAVIDGETTTTVSFGDGDSTFAQPRGAPPTITQLCPHQQLRLSIPAVIYPSHGGVWICDMCHQRMTADGDMWHCVEPGCNYDECAHCHNCTPV